MGKQFDSLDGNAKSIIQTIAEFRANMIDKKKPGTVTELSIKNALAGLVAMDPLMVTQLGQIAENIARSNITKPDVRPETWLETINGNITALLEDKLSSLRSQLDMPDSTRSRIGSRPHGRVARSDDISPDLPC